MSSSHDVVVGRATHTLLLDGGAVAAKHELLRGRGEVGKTCDGEVLVVEIRVVPETVIGLM